MTQFARFSAAAAILALARPVASQVEVETRVSASRVEQNEPFRIQLRASVEGAGSTPQNPQLTAPAGVQVRGPTLAPETRVSIMNGRMLQSSGLTATWILEASKPGKYRIGPPSMEIGGKTVQGEIKAVEVVPGGTLHRLPGGIPGRSRFDPFDFFDPFRGLPRFGFPLDEPEESEPEPLRYPPEFAVERAPDPIAFVTARVEPARVVVGQAVRFGVYAYGSRGAFQVQTATEPSRAGFIAHQDLAEPNVYEVPIGGQTFLTRKIYSLILFPIEKGTLRIGPTRIGFAGRGYPATPPAPLLTRESRPIDVVVVDPPLAGRPAGYRIGDVGQYTLKASVDPRKVRQGEAVSVIASLEGLGNVPTDLNEPQQSGVDWQDPTTSEKFESVEGVLRGERIFTYVVTFERAGQVDLGELTLPFYDPERRRYSIARATLGSVEVTPNPASAAAPSPASTEDRLRGVLSPRTMLRSFEHPASPLTDRTSFWLLLAIAPAGVLTARGLASALGKLSARIRARRETPAENAHREIASARQAEARGEFALAASAVERAVHLSIEAGTGLKSRAVLRSELLRALQERGVSQELAQQAVLLLEETENARFVGSPVGVAAELSSRADEFVRSALRVRRA